MTLQELYTGLSSLSIPVSYSHFTQPPTVPFIVYRMDGSDDFMADNRNYQRISDVSIELYTDIKDVSSEASLEQKLTDMGMTYTKNEVWVESELLFRVLYEAQIV